MVCLAIVDEIGAFTADPPLLDEPALKCLSESAAYSAAPRFLLTDNGDCQIADSQPIPGVHPIERMYIDGPTSWIHPERNQSLFSATGLRAAISHKTVQGLVLVGRASANTVIATVLDAVRMRLRVCVAEELVAAWDDVDAQFLRDGALKYMALRRPLAELQDLLAKQADVGRAALRLATAMLSGDREALLALTCPDYRALLFTRGHGREHTRSDLPLPASELLGEQVHGFALRSVQRGVEPGRTDQAQVKLVYTARGEQLESCSQWERHDAGEASAWRVRSEVLRKVAVRIRY